MPKKHNRSAPAPPLNPLQLEQKNALTTLSNEHYKENLNHRIDYLLRERETFRINWDLANVTGKFQVILKGTKQYHCTKHALNNLFQLSGDKCLTETDCIISVLKSELNIVKGIVGSKKRIGVDGIVVDISKAVPNASDKRDNWSLAAVIDHLKSIMVSMVFVKSREWDATMSLFFRQSFEDPNELPLYIMEVFTEEVSKRKASRVAPKHEE